MMRLGWKSNHRIQHSPWWQVCHIVYPLIKYVSSTPQTADKVPRPSPGKCHSYLCDSLCCQQAMVSHTHTHTHIHTPPHITYMLFQMYFSWNTDELQANQYACTHICITQCTYTQMTHLHSKKMCRSSLGKVSCKWLSFVAGMSLAHILQYIIRCLEHTDVVRTEHRATV